MKTIYEQRREQVKLLYLKGLTYSRIGKNIGISTSAVASIISRMAKAGVVELKYSSKKIDVTSMQNNLQSIKYHPFQKYTWDYIPKIGISIMELTNKTCRFPCNDGLYCGDDVSQRGYCAEHYAISVKQKQTEEMENA